MLGRRYCRPRAGSAGCKSSHNGALSWHRREDSIKNDFKAHADDELPRLPSRHSPSNLSPSAPTRPHGHSTHLGIALCLVNRAKHTTQLLPGPDAPSRNLLESLFAAEVCGRARAVPQTQLLAGLFGALGRLGLGRRGLRVDLG